MKLVIGLGNPGEKYLNTRHNAGFLVIDELANRLSLRVSRKECFSLLAEKKEAAYAKPQTFMNKSGDAVKCMLSKFDSTVKDLVVVYDDLDLPLGKLRVRHGGSSGGHKGVQSIIDCLADTGFTRIRLGISGEEKPKAVVDYVLSQFKKEEKETLQNSLILAADAVEFLLAGNTVEAAMNKYNG
ncbi:MAG: aminoacyl-tRNA hydrolase [Candidatus Firestonebacteria bacterium RIFOXYC2_FULL_39_67]|nr:MAG: aminoacyl-tRNA hydrolase [Candidatus Firestonebacteria bacterium RIFOXYD2_FULL_39_29]OGF56715.1 MAG: aminoacyl-tRNA hydrolase [Candidatus Firestonebacteria bacterium RIFOXYC2_FULL_39_67]